MSSAEVVPEAAIGSFVVCVVVVVVVSVVCGSRVSVSKGAGPSGCTRRALGRARSVGRKELGSGGLRAREDGGRGHADGGGPQPRPENGVALHEVSISPAPDYRRRTIP